MNVLDEFKRWLSRSCGESECLHCRGGHDATVRVRPPTRVGNAIVPAWKVEASELATRVKRLGIDPADLANKIGKPAAVHYDPKIGLVVTDCLSVGEVVSAARALLLQPAS